MISKRCPAPVPTPYLLWRLFFSEMKSSKIKNDDIKNKNNRDPFGFLLAPSK
jgi:hypothetical protein